MNLSDFEKTVIIEAMETDKKRLISARKNVEIGTVAREQLEKKIETIQNIIVKFS